MSTDAKIVSDSGAQLETHANSGISVRVFSSKNELASAIADRVCVLAAERHSEGRPLVLGLAAGASPQGVYRDLERRVRAGQLDLTRCVAFCLDEYYPIDPEDPRSYARQMSSVAAELGIPREMLRIPDGDLPRAQTELFCKQYEEEISLVGGIDFQILGVGRSGHIGFNEPGASRESRTRLVQLDERTLQDAATAFGGLDHVPREAITMGIETILEAKEMALIGMGEKKAAIIRLVVEEPFTSAIPASYLQAHDRATIYLDEEAAGLLAPVRCA